MTGIYNMMKKRYRAAGLLALLFPVLAWCQALADSIFVFRFLPGKDMFFSPALNNGDELQKLLAYVERHREKIVNGEIPLMWTVTVIHSKTRRKTFPLPRFGPDG